VFDFHVEFFLDGKEEVAAVAFELEREQIVRPWKSSRGGRWISMHSSKLLPISSNATRQSSR